MFKNFFFFENHDIYEIMWKNIVKTGMPQMTIWGMRIACWIPKARNKLRLCNTYCFSTTTVLARTHPSVTLYVHCLLCLIYYSCPACKSATGTHLCCNPDVFLLRVDHLC